MAILSGIAGAGGGFVMTPLLIFLGLSPAQAVSSGKFFGFSVTIGSLSGLREYKGKISKLTTGLVMVLAFVVGLIVPHIIKTLESRSYRLAMGIILLLMIPIMIRRKMGITKSHKPSLARKGLGGILLTGSLFMQGTFSSGLGSLVNIVLMGMLGQTAIEANITKRWSQLILNATIIVGVFGSGLIVWKIAAVAVAAGLSGSYIGGRIAVQEGNKLVINVMLVLMLISGIILVLGAL